MNIRFHSLFALTGLVLLASCSKEREDAHDPTIASTEVVARSVDASVEELADAIAFRSDSSGFNLPECVDVSDSGADEYPRLITLDFGDGCTDALGRTRAGMMHISISLPWSEVGSIRTVTFEDFTVTRPMQDVAVAVEGERQLERLEPGLDGETRWERNINTVLTHPDFTVERVFTGIRRWISGEGDPDANQVFGLTGSGSHTRNGWVRTRTILEELVIDHGCGEPISGTVEITRPMFEDGVLDYGDGECDGTATLTVGGEVMTIDL